MAIVRLLSPKLNHHFSSRGFLHLTRRCLSSSPDDCRKFAILSDSNASVNKDIGKKGMGWYSFGGFLTNLKDKVIENVLFIDKPPVEDTVLSKSPPMVPSVDVTASKVVSLQNVAEDRNCNKEETLVSEMGSRDAKTHDNSLEGSELAQDKVLRLMQGRKVDSSEVSESVASCGKKKGKLQLSSMFVNPDLEKEVKVPMRLEALSSSDVGDISKGNEKHGFWGPESWASIVPRDVSNDPKDEDLCRKVMVSLNLQTDNGADADTNSWSLNGGERKFVSNGSSETEKTDGLSGKEEEQYEGETLVVQDQSLCSQATLAAPTVNSKLMENSLDSVFVGKHSPNKLMLRFLEETSKKDDIVGQLSTFGAVLDIQELPSFKGCIYKDALLTFESNSAVKKALKKTVLNVKHFSAIVEATSQDDMQEEICIPDLIGDPDVPIALVKKPTRTVKIHPLDHDITSNQIKEALKFCKSDVSKFIMGSSKTAAFVEFETEDDKERALAEHSISISNKQLFISRIDIPRTTVARITNFVDSPLGPIGKQCVLYGQINKMTPRGKGIVDVQFDVTEWPNMLTILNSLNGKEVDGLKWVVRPATVIPHEILRVLWKDPQEKRHVKGLMKNMVKEIDQPLDASHIKDLVL